MNTPRPHPWMPPRFCLAWLLPLAVGAAAWRSPWAAWAVIMAFQLGLALIELLPVTHRSPPAVAPDAWHRIFLRGHVLLQALLLAFGLFIAQRSDLDWMSVVALGIAVGGVTGSLGITFAHELGHSRSRTDRQLGWALMTSVNYSHFMVEHYRGHHPRAATHDDPASARRGESLWHFLPRTVLGSWRNAWLLEAQQLRQLRRSWWRSPLAWAVAVQVTGMLLIGLTLGAQALVFWLVQAVYAVFLLETINYVEHYGLQRASPGGRREPFGMQHAWNADHWLTNSFIANLQRHSDHHMHAWKPYPSLEALPGPQLPTGYAGCIWMAFVPPVWFRVMHPRIERLQASAA